MPRCRNASAQECAGTDGAEPCHQWPCSLFRTSCIFPSSLLLLQLRTFPLLWYCNLPALISEREALSKSFKRKQNISQRKIIACWCAKSSYPCVVAAWLYHLPCNDWQFHLSCHCRQMLQCHQTTILNHLVLSRNKIKSAIHNRILKVLPL